MAQRRAPKRFCAAWTVRLWNIKENLKRVIKDPFYEGFLYGLFVGLRKCWFLLWWMGLTVELKHFFLAGLIIKGIFFFVGFGYLSINRGGESGIRGFAAGVIAGGLLMIVFWYGYHFFLR